MPDPTVSLVIPTYGRAEHLKGLIVSVRASAPREAFEIVVVSSDSPATEKVQWLRQQPEVRLLLADVRRNPLRRKRSLYHYTNLGIRAARHDWVFVVNDDMTFDPAWYECFGRTLARPDGAGIGMVIAASHIGMASLGLRTAVIGRLRRAGGEWRDLHLSDVAIIRRDLLESLGGFDERLQWYGSGLDNTLALEFLTQARIVVEPGIKITHAIARDGRQDSHLLAFRDFHYLKRKWDRWCRQHGCAYEWDPQIEPYTLPNRFKYGLQTARQELRNILKGLWLLWKQAA